MSRYVRMLMVILVSFALMGSSALNGIQPDKGTPPPPDANRAAIEQAVADSTGNRVDVLGFALFDVRVLDVTYSIDGNTALVWIALYDRQTGEPAAEEPGLAIARRADKTWQMTYMMEKEWDAEIASLPEELLTSTIRQRYLSSTDENTPKQTFSGYKLPWANGVKKHLSGSVGHFLDYHSCSEAFCRYAFDYSDGGKFPLLASKGGVVYSYYGGYPDRDDDACGSDGTTGNYLVLYDNSTTPPTYQLYLHMSNGSVPEELRTPGAVVQQGQFIGRVDNNGWSCGSHLHFMVYTTRTSVYWGYSVDITYDDVAINGGRPRTCKEAATWPEYGDECNGDIGDPTDYQNDWFVSGNVGANPPVGTLSLPLNGTVLDGSTVTWAGSASDNLGVTKAQLIAKLDNQWVAVGSAVTSNPFNASADLCTAGIGDGPVQVALRLWDLEGNQVDILNTQRTVVKNHACTPPPPTCQPTARQAAIYAAPNYQGACAVLDIGDYLTAADLPAVGGNNIESVQVGANVILSLYDNEELGEFPYNRREMLIADDANLANNRIGGNTVSSIAVVGRDSDLSEISVDPVFNDHPSNLNLKSTESYVFNWTGADYVTEYKSELYLGSTLVKTRDWSPDVYWSVGSLAAGTYTWKIWGRNPNNEVYWDNTTYPPIVINPASLTITTTATAPVTYTFESGTENWEVDGDWPADTLWHRAQEDRDGTPNQYMGFFDDTSDYASKTVGGEDLTSQPIILPAGSPYTLYFESYASTEDTARFWDQRWVQISIDGGAFTDIYQLYDEMQGAWVNVPPIDLSAYAGHTIRLRFHFDAVDRWNQSFPGWSLDNIRIENSLPDTTGCLEPTPNNTLAQAASIAYGAAVSAAICPSGDVDYYKFSGTAGQHISMDIDAASAGSDLDSTLALLDGHGNLLLYNDDQTLEERDSYISLILPRTETYYIRVRDWGYPTGGGSTYPYTLRLTHDEVLPVARLTNPADRYIGSGEMTLRAEASDPNGSIRQVDFYWHGPDWQNGSWILLGSDNSSEGGWTLDVTPGSWGALDGGAIWITAYDQVLNQWSDIETDIMVDSTPPAAQFEALPALTESSAIHLNWTVTDTESGADTQDLEVQRDGGSWEALASPPITQTSLWFQGETGHSYGFRLRAHDLAGNERPFPAAAEVATMIPETCTPDSYETDNTAATASLLATGASQQHSFCPPGDEDWAAVTVEAGKTYLFRAVSLSGGAGAKLELLASDGFTLLKQASAANYVQPAVILWKAEASDTIYLRATPFISGLNGTDVRYELYAGEGWWGFFPLVTR